MKKKVLKILLFLFFISIYNISNADIKDFKVCNINSDSMKYETKIDNLIKKIDYKIKNKSNTQKVKVYKNISNYIDNLIYTKYSNKSKNIKIVRLLQTIQCIFNEKSNILINFKGIKNIVNYKNPFFKIYETKISENRNLKFLYPQNADIIKDKINNFEKIIIKNKKYNNQLTFYIYDFYTEDQKHNVIKERFGDKCIKNYTLDKNKITIKSTSDHTCFVNYNYFSKYDKKSGKIIISEGRQDCIFEDNNGKCIDSKIDDSITFISNFR